MLSIRNYCVLLQLFQLLAKENGDEDDCVVELEDSVKKEWWQEYCDGDELNNIAHSSKLFLLFEILKECEQIGDKVY
jgi:transcriptional regulator ATRX